MEALFLRLVSLSITASYMIVAVMLLRIILRKAPRWIICVLWGLVALRLVCPVSLESRASLIPAAAPLTAEALYEDITLPREAKPDRGENAPLVYAGENAVVTTGTIAASTRTETAPQKPSTVYLLSLVWAAGTSSILLYSLVSYALLRRRLATAVCFREGLWQSETVTSPFVLGFFRPHIYLPFDIDLITAKYVVAHERAHIRRRDHLIKPLGYVLLAVYWFNPLVWAAYILLCRDIELACDERVVKQLSEDGRRNYALALLSCGMKRRLLPACPLTFAEVGVKERIKSVMTYRKPAFWLIVTSILVCAIAALCFLTNPVSAAEGELVQVSATMEPAPTPSPVPSPTATPAPTKAPEVTKLPEPTELPEEKDAAVIDNAQAEVKTGDGTSVNAAAKSGNTSTSTSVNGGNTTSTASTTPPDPVGGEVMICGATDPPENPNDWVITSDWVIQSPDGEWIPGYSNYTPHGEEHFNLIGGEWVPAVYTP